MGRTILTDGDAVMSKDEDHLEVREGGEADWRAHVVREDEEGRREGDHPAVRSHAVSGAAHGVLADTEVDVAPGVAPIASRESLLRIRIEHRGRWLKIAGAF